MKIRKALWRPICIALLACLWPARIDASTLPVGFSEAVLASGISNPTAMEIAPDGRIFVCQQNGALRVIKNGVLLTAPFLTLSVDPNGERGLLGIAFHPNFATGSPYVYVYYTAPGSPSHNRVSRFTANGDVAVAGSEVAIVDLEPLSATNHNGGAIHFGPDGKLYIAVGENAVTSNAQSLNNRLGKVLRVNADGTIPLDNPFYGMATGNNRAIWALGLRNPFTFAFQPGSGRMFINDVGASTWEEINEGVPGANYGWPACEGVCGTSGFRNPIYAYAHSGGACAIAGGTFYNPAINRFPSGYSGVYFFADLCAGWIRKLDPANGNQVTAFASDLSSPVDLKTGADGALYVLDRGRSGVFRISFNGGAPAITLHPQSQTVSVGEPVTFTVAASGTAPLVYQWQRNGANISGATSPSYTIASTTLGDSGATFRCVVSNPYGVATSNPATLTVNGNRPPTATILTPADGATYAAGNTIGYSGAASDPDESLGAAAFSWVIEFHHADHVHPFLGPINGRTSGSFTIQPNGETATDVFYRIILTVTDSGGRQGTDFVDVAPQVVTLTLTTSPAGLDLTLDGQPVPTPFSFPSVVGMNRTLGVISPQKAFRFDSWSDGEAASHVIGTPSVPTTYTAFFRKGRK